MEMMEKFQKDVSMCRTQKQLLSVLGKYNKTIVKQSGNDSFWLDDLTRVYKPYGRKHYVVQRWQKIQMEYSGIPVFFG